MQVLPRTSNLYAGKHVLVHRSINKLAIDSAIHDGQNALVSLLTVSLALICNRSR